MPRRLTSNYRLLQKYEWFGKITAPKQEPEKTAETITT